MPKAKTKQALVGLKVEDLERMSPTKLRRVTFDLWLQKGCPCPLPNGGGATRDSLIAFGRHLINNYP